jgi:type IV pilus assembly protein PilE
VARSGEEVRRRNVTTARPHGAGFTLMELLIAVAVIALLAAIALPAYQDQLLKARRSEGKTALLKALQLEERHYTSNGTYIADLGPLFGLAAGVVPKSGDDPAQGRYSLTAAADPANGNDLKQGVLLTATPVTGFSDPYCGILTINSLGVKTFASTNGKGTKDVCW